ncbi:MAG: hypothetical protein KAU07_02530 [Candidatus Andersenbacteria bacterium]|nr:hypothetical protein [Candidatus Andersenbacteria bacterium]
MTELDGLTNREDESINQISSRAGILVVGAKRWYSKSAKPDGEKKGLDPEKLKKILEVIGTQSGLKEVCDFLETEEKKIIAK